MNAKFDGSCKCGAKVIQGDCVRFANKKIVACPACTTVDPIVLEPGDHVAWNWAYMLGRDLATLRRIYAAIRAAYFSIPVKGAHGVAITSSNYSADFGVCGRSVATTEAFDDRVKASMASEVKDWAGADGFDRLTVGQLFCLHAAHEYVGAACGVTLAHGTDETRAWSEMEAGERLNHAHHAFPALNAIVTGMRKAA